MGDEGGRGESKIVRERKRRGERAFSLLINLLDPVPLMPMTAYLASSDSGSAGRQPRGADLAEIQSRSFYQPPEVDLTSLFLDSESA